VAQVVKTEPTTIRTEVATKLHLFYDPYTDLLSENNPPVSGIFTRAPISRYYGVGELALFGPDT
jgi:hypothetical protein